MHNNIIVKLLFLSISLLLYIGGGAQEVEGLWIGSLKTKGSIVHYELLITKEKENYTGYALSLIIIDGIENIGVKTVKLKLKNKLLLLEDENLVYNNFKTPPKKSKLIARLYAIPGSDSLNGTFNTRSLDFTDRTSYDGDLQLQKTNGSGTSLLLGKLAQLNLLSDNSIAAGKVNQTTENKIIPSNEVVEEKVSIVTEEKVPANTETTVKHPTRINNIETETPKPINKPFVENKPTAAIKIYDPFQNRKIEIIETITVKLDSVTIALYDNGIVDGDTVSIYLNGILHLQKKELGTTAIRSTIYFPSTFIDSLELIMYAENLGTIPPNTGLLIIEDGSTRHEIRFSGDLQKNAAIILRRKR